MAKKNSTKTTESIANCNQLSNKVTAGMESPNGVIANCDNLPQSAIESKILTIRGQQVIIDRDLAGFYGVETKTLNQAVKRNLERFPEYYRFHLTKEEINEVVTNCDHLLVLKFSPNRAFAFTERRVAQRKGDFAIAVSPGEMLYLL